MQNRQATLIAPVEALTQQVAGSVSTMPSLVGDALMASSELKTLLNNANESDNDSASSLAEYHLSVSKAPVSKAPVSKAPVADILDIDNFGNVNNRDNVSTQQASIFLHRQGFRINNYNLMVKFEDGNQISEIPSIYPLPNAPKWLLGMSNINGQTIPVFDLKEYFGIANYKDKQRAEHDIPIHDIPIKDNKMTMDKKTPMLFVIQHGDNATGIIIDGLLERLNIDDSKLQPNINLPNKLRHCTNNSYLLNKELWYDLNCLDFLDEIEKQITS